MIQKLLEIKHKAPYNGEQDIINLLAEFIGDDEIKQQIDDIIKSWYI